MTEVELIEKIQVKRKWRKALFDYSGQSDFVELLDTEIAELEMELNE